MIGFIALYTFTQLGTTRNYGAVADLHTLRFTVTHALGYSVFTSRILATDFITVSLSLRITHEGFFAPPNSFLAIILQLPIPKTRLHSIPLLPSSCPGRLSSRNSTLLDLVSFMLRPTVSRPVCLGIKHPFEVYDQIFITHMTITVFFSCGAPSLTRGRV
jgi:hypothetical protein